ncbi:MAG: ATP-binding cassette domain-containing protein [Verrucomicrobiales bacterium]
MPTTDRNHHLIEFRNVSMRFFRTQALNDVSFTVPSGSVTALLGANGAGKSTALRIAVNLLRPSGGSAQVLGVDSCRLPAAESEAEEGGNEDV